MARISIETHNLTVQATSGNTIIPIAMDDGCIGVDVYTSGGTLTPSSLRLSRMGSDILLEWNANNSTAGLGTVIVVEAQDRSGNTITDAMAFNQLGSSYNISVNGPVDFEGDTISATIPFNSTTNGTFSVASQSSWITVRSVTKLTSNAGNTILTFPENYGDPRYGVVRFQVSYQNNPYSTVFYVVYSQGIYVPKESSLVYEPNSVSVNYNAGTYTSNAPTMQNISGLSVRSVTGTMNITSTEIDQENGRLIVNYEANNGDDELNATITIGGTGTSGDVTTVFYIYQGSYSYVVNPIWKTTVVDITGRDYINYTISTDGNVVYSGRAYQMPGDGSISFELNEIVRDYVDNTLWWRSGYQTPLGWQRTFTLEMDNGDTGDYIFTKDWSYVERDYSSNQLICLNEPIINTIPEGCFVPVCVFSPQRAGNTSFTTTNTQGNRSITYTVDLDNPRQARYLFTAVNGYKYGIFGPGMVKDEIYTGTDRCFTPFVLYYENAYGGIDALPIQGKVTASDKITSYTTRNAVRVPSTSFSYRRYLNDISKTWELNTKYLSDLQSSRMHHLIESTLVYLYDVAADKLFPVVIDENSLTYKTYKNQGRKFYNYTFKVRESQNKIRK